MANTLRFKRGLVATIPTALAGEPLFTTDTFDLYIGNGTGNTRFQKYIASGATTQILRGDGSLYTFPLAISSPTNGQVLKYNGTNWVNDSDAGITGSGAAGQVAYFTGATTQGGNNNLFWSTVNNRLGIGFSDPKTKLDVRGTSATAESTIQIVGNSVSTLLLGQNADGGVIRGQGGNNVLSFWTGGVGDTGASSSGTERMRLDSSGNLGLGVTPSAWSSVVPAFQIGSGGSFLAGRSANPEIYLGTNARFNGTNWLYQTTNTATYYAQDTGRHIWYQAPSGTAGNAIAFTQAMTLTANGRLLLGTITEGTFRLAVNGGIQLGNDGGIAISLPDGQAVRTSGIMYLDYGNGGTGNLIFRGGTSLLQTAIFYNNNNINLASSGGSVGIQQPSPVTKLDVNGAMAVAGPLAAHQTDRGILEYNTNKVALRAYGNTSGTGFIAFNTGGGGGTADTERMRIDANGSVGIGTTSITGILHARISASAEMYFQNVSQNNLVVRGTNATLVLNTTSANFPGIRLQLAGANIGGIEANGTSNIDLVGLNSTTAITFRQVSNERARFAATTGNFLIGSTSDSGEKLQVNGTMKVTGASTFNGAMTLSANTTSAYAAIFNQTNTTNDVSFGVLIRGGTTISDVAFRIQNAAANQNLFSVLGNGVARIISAGGGSFTQQFTLQNNTANPSLIAFENTANGVAFGFSSTGTQRFVFINGALSEIASISGGGAATFSSSVTGASFIPTSSTIPTNGMYLPSTNSLGFATNGTLDMTINSRGDIGVGLTPSTWSLGKSIEINNAGQGITSLQLGDTLVMNGVYYNSSLRYANSTYAISLYRQFRGQHTWYYAPQGTIGNTVTFDIPMTLETTGNLLIGSTTDDTVNRLQVTGSGKFSSSVTSTQFNLSALNTAPATSSSTGTLGEIRIDADHIYVCTATNTWKRVAISTF